MLCSVRLGAWQGEDETMTMITDQERLESHARLQEISVTELLLRLARYPDGFPPAFVQAAEMTASLPAGDVSQMAYQASLVPAAADLSKALAEIAADRYQATR